MRHHFQSRSQLPYSPETVFRWHENADALIRLTPPWESMKIVKGFTGFEDGKKVIMKVKTGPVWQKWVAEHYGYEPPNQFCDRQLSGPFKFWEHVHQFRETDYGCELRDDIHYEMIMSPISDSVAGWFTKSKITAMFDYRHRVTKGDLEYQQRVNLEPKKILISGSSGLVGTQLSAYLSMAGHEVWSLKRKNSGDMAVRDETKKNVHWNPKVKVLNPEVFSGFDAVIHLAGAGIADKRWSDTRKKVLRNSRIEDTRNLAVALAEADEKPSVFISGSAIGYYGNRGDEILTEESKSADDFLGKLSIGWEAAADPAAEAGIRTVKIRTGIVLSPAGGALDKMLTPFMMGLGGKLGDGKFWMSWIAIDDMLSGIEHLIADESISGPVNLTAPNPVTNAEFTRTLCNVLNRIQNIPAPVFALKVAFGEMAEEALLASTKVVPQAIQTANYDFRYSELEDALRHVLGYE